MAVNPAYRIETDRLLLRCWSPDDAHRLRPALDRSADHLRPWIPFMKDEPRDLRQTADWLADIRAMFDRRENFRYGVFEKDSGELVGENMLLTRAGPGALEIGYLTHLGFEGKGYASEATAAMIRVGFEVHDAGRLEIHCAEDNLASAAIPARFGFRHDGTLRERAPDTEGGIHDLMIWSLMQSEYPESSAGSLSLSAWDQLEQRLI